MRNHLLSREHGRIVYVRLSQFSHINTSTQGRSDLANAEIAGLTRDWSISSQQYSNIAGMFYVGYLILQLPSTLLVRKLTPPVQVRFHSIEAQPRLTKPVVIPGNATLGNVYNVFSRRSQLPNSACLTCSDLSIGRLAPGQLILPRHCLQAEGAGQTCSIRLLDICPSGCVQRTHCFWRGEKSGRQRWIYHMAVDLPGE